MLKESMIKLEIYKSIAEEKCLCDEIILLYSIKGQSYVQIDADNYIMEKDDILIVNENSKCSFKTEKDSTLICIKISYNELCRISDLNNIRFNCSSIRDCKKDYAELSQSINRILDCFLKSEKKIQLISLQYQLIDILLDKFMISSYTPENNSLKEKYSERLNAIKNYINNNYNKQITLNDLANKEYLSVPYLSKFIKEQLGVTFTEYVNGIRLNHAVRDIVNTDLPLTRVSLDNGFATTFIFNKYFKENYNMTPSEYRKKFKKIVKEDSENIEDAKAEIETYLSEVRQAESLNNKDSQEIMVQTDINNSTMINRNYNKIINIGYANDLLESLLQEHIVLLRNDIKFEYARFWGIFNEDMNIENSNGEYNFYKIDKILDFIIGCGMKPFIDLMPKAKRISKNIVEFVEFENKSVKLKRSEEWGRLIHKFIVHCINKYGREEVENWYFDISRSENISICKNEKDKNLLYCETFKIIYSRIKEIIPNAKVGGPGGNFTKSSALEFFKEWRRFDIKPDFISLYIYPYTALVRSGTRVAQASSERDYLLNKLNKMNKVTKELGFSTHEIIISEWNSTVSDRNYINDSAWKASYIVKNVIDSVNKADKIGYRIASDVSSEYLDTNLLLQGGTGLISKNGIKKPAFYAFSFLEKMSTNLVDKGENYIITKNSNNSFSMICHNYKQFNNSYLLNSEENVSINQLEDIYEDEKNLNISFSIKNINKGRYRVKSFILNEKHGSILNEWIELGSDNHLRADEIDYLKSITKPKLEIEHIDIGEEKLNYSLELLPHEVRLITFEIDYN